MRLTSVTPTNREVFFPRDDLIVSKTDLRDHISYVNRTFIDISGYDEAELLDEPHSVIRHPEMPRCIFQLLWETIKSEHEIFAFIRNMCKNGDHYWVLAHVTPTFDSNRTVIGFHSNRRVPERKHVAMFSDLYEKLLTEERRHSDWRSGIKESTRILAQTTAAAGLDYEQYVFSI
jgi:PAS domain S-box-containing protein